MKSMQGAISQKPNTPITKYLTSACTLIASSKKHCLCKCTVNTPYTMQPTLQNYTPAD